MIRRIVLAGGALVAAASLSSCTSFSRSDAAAEVNGVELTRVELGVLTDGATDGDTVRNVINGWVSLVVLGGDGEGIVNTDDLKARSLTALGAIAEPFADDARAVYEQGLDGSPVLCLGAIPLGQDTDPQTVLDELASGATLADTAAKYSVDPTLAQAGGLVTDQDGNNCLDTSGFNPDLLTLLADNGATPGSPVQVDLGSGPVIVLLRSFDDLSPTEVVPLVPDQMRATQSALLADSDIYVNPRFGRWDPQSVAVVALGNG